MEHREFIKTEEFKTSLDILSNTCPKTFGFENIENCWLSDYTCLDCWNKALYGEDK